MATAIIGNPQKTDLVVIRNVALRFSIQWLDGSGSPITITAVKAEFLESYEGTLIADISSYCTIDPVTSQTIYVNVPDTETVTMTEQSGAVWQLVAEQEGSTVGYEILLRGSLLIQKGMT